MNGRHVYVSRVELKRGDPCVSLCVCLVGGAGGHQSGETHELMELLCLFTSWRAQGGLSCLKLKRLPIVEGE